MAPNSPKLRPARPNWLCAPAIPWPLLEHRNPSNSHGLVTLVTPVATSQKLKPDLLGNDGITLDWCTPWLLTNACCVKLSWNHWSFQAQLRTLKGSQRKSSKTTSVKWPQVLFVKWPQVLSSLALFLKQLRASDECDEVQGCASILVAISEGTTMSDVSHIVIYRHMVSNVSLIIATKQTNQTLHKGMRPQKCAQDWSKQNNWLEKRSKWCYPGMPQVYNLTTPVTICKSCLVLRISLSFVSKQP